MTQQPHPTVPQVDESRQTIPVEATGAAGAVHTTHTATRVPESAEPRRAVIWPPVVVTVERRELLAVVGAERIVAGVTREPAHMHRVVDCLGQYSERAVLGVVPVAGATLLQVELQLVAVVGCQLTESIVAEPEVAVWITKSHFELRPRTIEEARPVVLLY